MFRVCIPVPCVSASGLEGSGSLNKEAGNGENVMSVDICNTSIPDAIHQFLVVSSTTM